MEADPVELWHYTNLNGLMGILESLTLRAHDILLLNDSQEYRKGVELLREYVAKHLMSDERLADVEKEVVEQYVDGIVWQLDRNLYPSRIAFGHYVASLSESKDQLSQWRGYGSDGYAICFDYKNLKNDVKHNPNLNNLAMGDRILLDRALYIDRPEDIIRDIDGVRRLADDIVGGKPIGIVFNNLYMSSFAKLSFIKDKSFSEEKEYRILLSSNRNVAGHVPSKLGPKSYVNIKFDRKTIKKVMIGPGPELEIKQIALQRYLSNLGYCDSGNIVECSAIPFRG